MGTTTQGGEATSSNTIPDLNLEQMSQIVAALSGATIRPKAKEARIYYGEQHDR